MALPTNTVFAAAIGLRDRQVALVRAGETWALPAAAVARGESPQKVALDVLQQQTGLAAAVDRLSGVYAGDDGLLAAYLASLEEGKPRAGVSFFGPYDLPAHIASPLHAAALAEWVAGHMPESGAARYCPRCGGARLSMQHKFGRDRLTCGTCGFIFFRDPKVGAGVFVEEDGRVLLIRRAVNPGMELWCLPSGFIEHDESPEAAAMREAKEETGLDVRLDELMGLHTFRDTGKGHGILILYRAHRVGGALAPGDDAKEARYFARHELPAPEQIAFRTHRIVLEQWRREKM